MPKLKMKDHDEFVAFEGWLEERNIKHDSLAISKSFGGTGLKITYLIIDRDGKLQHHKKVFDQEKK